LERISGEEEEKRRWRWRWNLCGSEGRHGGPVVLMSVQSAFARMETLLSIVAGVSTALLCGGCAGVLVVLGRKEWGNRGGGGSG
jgi:hypothetical protein